MPQALENMFAKVTQGNPIYSVIDTLKSLILIQNKEAAE